MFEWSDEAQVPYAFSPDEWIGYEDTRSIDIKAKYIVDKGFAGAMFFSLNYDDHDGGCKKGKYPLLRVINNHLNPRHDRFEWNQNEMEKIYRSNQLKNFYSSFDLNTDPSKFSL